MERKAIVWMFQAVNKRNLTWEDLDMAKKEEPYKRNWISSNSNPKQRHNDKLLKTKIDKMQHNSLCRLCVDGDETIDHLTNQLGL